MNHCNIGVMPRSNGLVHNGNFDHSSSIWSNSFISLSSMRSRLKHLLWKSGCLPQQNVFSYYQGRNLSLIFYGSDQFSLSSLKCLVSHQEKKDLITKLEVVTKVSEEIDMFP